MELLKETDDEKIYIEEMEDSEKAIAFDNIMIKFLELNCYESETACQNDDFMIEIPYIVGEILDEYLTVEHLDSFD